VAIKFPNEKQLSDSYKSDVLDITQRLKNIVNGILLLQKCTSGGELDKQDVNLKLLLQRIVERENTLGREIILNCEDSAAQIEISEIAIETILTNLISNALFYSPDNTSISISVSINNKQKTIIEIMNTTNHHYSDSDLAHFFEPLWQKDKSRTSSQRYGLGLAIVKSYCDNIGAAISIKLMPKNKVIFTVVF
jgi:signal transduction histidine kinase